MQKAYKRGLCVRQDIAAAHVHICCAAIQKFELEIVEYPLCSFDFAPTDYYLFPNKKKDLGGRLCALDDVLM